MFLMSGNVIRNFGLDFCSSETGEKWQNKGEILMELLLGKQKAWKLVVDEENATFRLYRLDGQYFEIDFLTDGYDRPVLVNYGIGKIASILMSDGTVAVEPEKISSGINGESVEQNRVLRASQDNPTYKDLPKNDTPTGKNFLDGQRIIYRDGLVESHAMAATEAPTRKVKDKDAPEGFKFVECESVLLNKIGEFDGPGKISIYDLMALLLTDEEWANIGRELFSRLIKLQE